MISKRLSVFGRFMATVEEYGLLPEGSRVLVAVSGGADSVCLLDLLRLAAPRLGLKLAGFHLNHRLRPSSGRDEAFVREFFAGLGVELVTARSDVAGYARRHRLGIEEAGREVRHRHFGRVARKLGCDRIALGHTADDNLETVLLNLVRGTGPRGLAGIPIQRGRVVRPLLDLGRADVERHLRSREIAWVEDESNVDVRFRRNLLRHKVIPHLVGLNPAVAANVRRTCRLLADEVDLLDALAARALDRIARVRRRVAFVDIDTFNAYNNSLKRRMLKQLLPESDAEGIDQVVRACSAGTPTRLQLGRNVDVRLRRGALELTTQKEN